MVKIITDFESGNIGPWHLANSSEIHFHAPLDQGMYAMWFYFRIEEAKPGPLDLVLTNLDRCLEPRDWIYARPVCRVVGSHWQRIHTDPEVNLEKGTFRFTVTVPTEGIIEVAFCYPYTSQELKSLCEELVKYPGVEISYPIKSEAGRPVPYIHMACLGDKYASKSIWAISREHAGEVSGAYTLDGFLRAVAKSPLRQYFEIHSLPMMALDSVVEGKYGKVMPPADYWEGWFAASPRPEIGFIMEKIASDIEQGITPQLLLTFHSPSAENDSYLVVPNPTLLQPEQREAIYKLAHLLKQETGMTINESTSAKSLSWRVSTGEEVTGPGWVSSCYGALGCTIETSYNGMPDGTLGGPRIWRQYGASIARAIERFLLRQTDQKINVYGSLPTVMTQNQGWVFWELPSGCQVQIAETEASLYAFTETSSVCFATPHKYAVHDLPNINLAFNPTFDTTYHNGGIARVYWLPYDARGWRLFIPPLETVVPVGQRIRLVAPMLDDARVAQLRPSFYLSGAFGEFRVRLT